MSESSSNQDGGGPRCRWHASADAATWARQAAEAIAQALAADLERTGRALLLVSCGNTPSPVYRELAGAAIDWSRVEIGLVDECWTAPGSAGSHGRQVRETLLTGPAAKARLIPLVTGLDDPELAARAGSAWFHGLGRPPTVIVFGMDDDGHTASLFPRSGGLEHAFATSDAYAVIDASGCPEAGAFPTRITLTPAAFTQATTRVLLIRGASRRKVFELALAGNDARELPIRSVIHAGGSPLLVHWYP